MSWGHNDLVTAPPLRGRWCCASQEGSGILGKSQFPYLWNSCNYITIQESVMTGKGLESPGLGALWLRAWTIPLLGPPSQLCPVPALGPLMSPSPHCVRVLVPQWQPHPNRVAAGIEWGTHVKWLEQSLPCRPPTWALTCQNQRMFYEPLSLSD